MVNEDLPTIDGRNEREIHELKQRIVDLEKQLADCTTEKRALTGDHDLLRLLINVLPDDVFVKDCQGRFVLNNTAHLKLLGVESQDHARGKHDRDFFPKELATQYHADEQKILATKKAMIDYEEQTVDHESGKLRWHATSKVPLIDIDGTTLGLAGICRDITERKRLEIERLKLLDEVQSALAKIRTLNGLIPICSSCKRIRDDKGYWQAVELYVEEHSTAEFTHGICPECTKRLYDTK